MTISKQLAELKALFAELKALCDAATPGPFRVPDLDNKADPLRHFCGVVNGERVFARSNHNFDTYHADELFIAAACNSTPAMIAALEEILAFCEAPDVPSYISIRPARDGCINRDEMAAIIERHLGVTDAND